MSKILDNFKDTQYSDVYQPFEEMIDLPDEEFDRFYPTFKKDLEKLLASPEMENVIMNAVKTTPNIDVQKEKDITETTDMDYMVESTSQLEQEENKNEYNVLKEATPVEAEVVTPNTSNIKEETVVQKNETLFDEPTF